MRSAHDALHAGGKVRFVSLLSAVDSIRLETARIWVRCELIRADVGREAGGRNVGTGKSRDWSGTVRVLGRSRQRVSEGKDAMDA